MAVGARETVDTLARTVVRGDRSNYKSTVLALFSVGGLGALHGCLAVITRKPGPALATAAPHRPGRRSAVLALLSVRACGALFRGLTVCSRVLIWTLAGAIVFGNCSFRCATVLALFSIGGLGALHQRLAVVSRVAGLALATAISSRSERRSAVLALLSVCPCCARRRHFAIRPLVASAAHACAVVGSKRAHWRSILTP